MSMRKQCDTVKQTTPLIIQAVFKDFDRNYKIQGVFPDLEKHFGFQGVFPISRRRGNPDSNIVEVISYFLNIIYQH